MKKLSIYSKRFTAARGWHWVYERECNSDSVTQWIAVFEEDEPDVEFIYTDKNLRNKSATIN